ncbi:MAG: cobalt ECF transporter T component CbiQ [Elusimicrobia bacterium]|nr:cobalt ECF transporter T component CbiQ [Elusimicrobiota bacterium]
MSALSFFKDALYADAYALKKGFLQSRDPRINVAAILLLIIAVLFVRDTAVLVWLYTFCLLLAACSKINLLFFIKRTWFFIPLFSLFIAVPAVFNFVTPGHPVFMFTLLHHPVTITREGLSGATLFVMRVATSVSLVILLSLTTKHTELLKVLRILKIPQLFVMTLGMCYRYIYLFVEIIEHTHLAIKSRAGTNIKHKKGREIATWSITNLWIRSYHLNNQVYSAMLSRGYRGEPQVLHEFKTTLRDWAWITAAAAISTLSFAVY